MLYELNGKNIKIPDDEIKNNMKALDLTEQEAIQVWLEDEGYLDNEEQEALCKKAKDNKIMQTIHKAKAEDTPRKPRAKVVKEYPDKEMIIAAIAQTLADTGIQACITNKSKLIEFTYNENNYKIDLICKRKPKEK